MNQILNTLYEAAALDKNVKRWAALRTSSRWEKLTALDLAKCQVPVFLPLTKKVVCYPGKQRASLVPLFPGYVFCSEEHFLGRRKSIACGRHIAQVLKPLDYEQLRHELSTISGILQNRELIQEHLHGKPGARVFIRGGSLAGYEGVIQRLMPGKFQLVLEVSLLNTRVEIEIDEAMVEKIT